MKTIILKYTFDEKLSGPSNQDNDLADLADICLYGEESLAAGTQVAQKIAAAIAAQRVYTFDYPKLLDSLATAQPIVFLDVFLRGSDREENQRGRMFSHDFDLVWHGNPLNNISDDALLSWCEKDSAIRYPVVASAIQPFKKSAQTGRLEWKPIMYAILERAPDLDAILKPLADSVTPKSWSGSLADILQNRLALFEELYSHDNAKVRAWAKVQHSKLEELIRTQRESEYERNRERNERFE